MDEQARSSFRARQQIFPGRGNLTRNKRWPTDGPTERQTERASAIPEWSVKYCSRKVGLAVTSTAFELIRSHLSGASHQNRVTTGCLGRIVLVGKKIKFYMDGRPVSVQAPRSLRGYLFILWKKIDRTWKCPVRHTHCGTINKPRDRLETLYRVWTHPRLWIKTFLIRMTRLL